MSTDTTSTTTTAPAAAETVSAYLATWNATDGSARRRLLDEHWAPDVTYVDPLAAVSGRDGVDAVVSGAQAQFPGLVFSPVGAVDGHHDQLRFQWGLGPAGGEPVVLGFDVVVLDAEGRIREVRGFLDRVPA